MTSGGSTNAVVDRFVASAPAGWVGRQTAGTAGTATNPRVAAFAGQSGLAVWADGGQIDYGTFALASGWSAKATVGTLVSTAAADLQLASNGTNSMATWLQAVGSVTNVYGSLFTGGVSSTPLLISDGSHSAVSGAGHTPVGIDGQGNAFSLWFQGSASQPDLMISRFSSAAGAWGMPTKIATAAGAVSYMQLAVAANGVAVVTWSVGATVYGSFYVPSGAVLTGTGGSGGAGGIGGDGGGGLGPNLITNGDFSNGLPPWHVVDINNSGIPIVDSIQNGQLCVTDNQHLLIGWPATAAGSVALAPNSPYVFSYQARFVGPETSPVTLFAHVGPFTGGSDGGGTDLLTPTLQTYWHPFTSTSTGDPTAGVAFDMNNVPAGTAVCVGGVSLAAGNAPPPIGGTVQLGVNLIGNGDFSSGQTGWTVTGATATAGTGGLCVNVGAGATVQIVWPADTAHSVPIVAGATYEIRYDFSRTYSNQGVDPSLATTVEIDLAGSSFQYVSYQDQVAVPTTNGTMATTTLTHIYTAPYTEPNGALMFTLKATGGLASDTVCYDNVSVVPLLGP